MAPTTMPPSRERKSTRVVPVRACSRCTVVDDVFHLTMVGRHWLCRECHRGLSYPGVGVGAPPPEDPEPTDAQAAREELRRIDRMLRWGGFALKVAFYVALLVLTSRHPLAEHVLFGFFVADTIGWVVHAWFDARFHGHLVTSEAVFYTIVFAIMYAFGLLDMPAGIEAQYLAGGTAASALALRGARFWAKLTVHPI